MSPRRPLGDEQLLLEALSALAVLTRELDFGEHLAYLRLRARRMGEPDVTDVAKLSAAVLRGRAVMRAIGGKAIVSKRRRPD